MLAGAYPIYEQSLWHSVKDTPCAVTWLLRPDEEHVPTPSELNSPGRKTSARPVDQVRADIPLHAAMAKPDTTICSQQLFYPSAMIRVRGQCSWLPVHVSQVFATKPIFGDVSNHTVPRCCIAVLRIKACCERNIVKNVKKLNWIRHNHK